MASGGGCRGRSDWVTPCGTVDTKSLVQEGFQQENAAENNPNAVYIRKFKCEPTLGFGRTYFLVQNALH
jgi:hypothetical protein